MEKSSIFSPTLQAKFVNPKLWGKVEQLNLNIILDRLLYKHGWSVERSNHAIEGYRKFLYMTQISEDAVAPTKDIDVVWHEHILHTNKYAIDCQKMFGRFLHHFPTPEKWKLMKEDVLNTGSCAGGSCEGKCSNDSCDSGTTNCGNSCNADCSKRSSNFNFDDPIMELRNDPIQFSSLEKIFFN